DQGPPGDLARAAAAAEVGGMNIHLDPQEAVRLEMLEEIVGEGWQDLTAWLDGPQFTERALASWEALGMIKQEKLYRRDGTWEEYTTKRWQRQITPQHANFLIKAVAVVRILQKSEDASSLSPEELSERKINEALQLARKEGLSGAARLERAADILRG